MLQDCLPEYFTLPKSENEDKGVLNWFDDKTQHKIAPLTFNQGFYSVKDTIREILENDEAGMVLANAFSSVTGMSIKKSLLMMFADSSVQQVLNNPDMASKSDYDLEFVMSLVNSELQKIPVV